MWRVGVLAALVVSLAGPAWACTEGKSPYAFEQITVSTSSIGLTSATWDSFAEGACAEIRVETDSVRYRLTGTPTSSVGIPLAANDVLYLENVPDSDNFSDVRFIRSGSGDATLSVQYWR